MKIRHDRILFYLSISLVALAIGLTTGLHEGLTVVFAVFLALTLIGCFNNLLLPKAKLVLAPIKRR